MTESFQLIYERCPKLDVLMLYHLFSDEKRDIVNVFTTLTSSIFLYLGEVWLRFR